MSHLLLRLDTLTLEQRGYLGLKVAEIHEIVILSELTSPGVASDAQNWCAPVTAGSPSLKHLGLAQYAYSAPVQETWLPPPDRLPLQYSILGTHPPLSLVNILDEEEGAWGPEVNEWVYGLTALHLSWPELNEVPLSTVVPVVITGIQRLILQPGPMFGQITSLSALPPAPLGADLVFVEVQQRDGFKIRSLRR